MFQEKRNCKNVREIWQKYYAHMMTEIAQKEKQEFMQETSLTGGKDTRKHYLDFVGKQQRYV